MNIELLLEHYQNERRNGMEYSQIRRELKARQLKEEEMRYIMRSVENQDLLDEEEKQVRRKLWSTVYIGTFLVLLSLALSLGNYLSFVPGKFYVLYFASLSVGSGLMLTSRKQLVQKKSMLFQNRKKIQKL
jgi:hypothetical protein